MLEAGKLEGGAYMKLDMVGTANRRMSNVEPQNVEGPCCQKNLLKGLK